MILCDIDGVLATARHGDTACGETIYRTFVSPPEEWDRIRSCGIAIHAVTAKAEGEAWQVLEAVGLEDRVDGVVGADRLFWPTVWTALRRGRLPGSVFKSVYRRVLPVEGDGPVVMVEDRHQNLVEMLDSGSVDYGVLVPPISVVDDRVASWFDLNLALRVARCLAQGDGEIPGSWAEGLRIFRREGGAFLEVERPLLAEGSCLLRLPPCPASDGPSASLTLDSLSTERMLEAVGPNLVTTVRAGRQALRRVARPFARG